MRLLFARGLPPRKNLREISPPLNQARSASSTNTNRNANGQNQFVFVNANASPHKCKCAHSCARPRHGRGANEREESNIEKQMRGKHSSFASTRLLQNRIATSLNFDLQLRSPRGEYRRARINIFTKKRKSRGFVRATARAHQKRAILAHIYEYKYEYKYKFTGTSYCGYL